MDTGYVPPAPARPRITYPQEFRVVCPKCGERLDFTSARSLKLEGNTFECYACGAEFTVELEGEGAHERN